MTPSPNPARKHVAAPYALTTGELHPGAGDDETAGPQRSAARPRTRLISVRARKIRPGDYLPPQQCLDPTPWQDSGFPVGGRGRDVRFKKVATIVLLNGPLGILDILREQDTVSVVRTRRLRGVIGSRP